MKKRAVVQVFFWCAMIAGVAGAQNVVEINQVRGEYEINFQTVFEIPIYPDIETMISMPPGYRITLAMPGSPDYVSANVLQNTLYLTRPVDHAVETNVAVHVITPEGLEEKLMLRCKGFRKSKNKVLAVQFVKPNSSAMNRSIEAMKARYVEQLNAKMSAQEKALSDTVFNKTMADARSWFIHSGRKKVNREYKGAEVFLEGMINSGDNTYVYMVSTVKNGSCDIIDLERVSVGKKQLIAQLVGVRELGKNEYYYCWAIPQIKIDGKRKSVTFITRIWSKVCDFSAHIS